MDKRLKTISIQMSYILRHDPYSIGLMMDSKGWCSTKALCEKLSITLDELNEIVITNSKQRFKFNDDKSLIRASQGHSIKGIDLELSPLTLEDTPEFLYHGTSKESLPIIIEEGLKNISRDVHLSLTEDTAIVVGKRKDKDPVIIKIDATAFVSDGNDLYVSDNGVYLAKFVDPKYFNSYLIWGEHTINGKIYPKNA